MNILPEDIKIEWLNVVRRLQSVAGMSSGAAIIHMTIVVDQNGDPSFWAEPTLTKLEPKRCTSEILELLKK